MNDLPQNRISGTDADRLIAAHDGDVALLYIWLSRRERYDVNMAASELCRTKAEIEAAAEKLRRMGLLEDKLRTETLRQAPDISQEPPEYNAEDIIRRSTEDSAFATILDETKRILGKTSLTRPDMNALFTMYDYLAMPPEIILMLIHYYADYFEEKYGPGRRPSMRSIEQEAYSWAHKEIFTIEQAEEHIRSLKERRSELNLIKSDFGIRDRSLSATEQKYISSWLDMGFGREELLIAYDRTVTNTNSLKWTYMNKIILSWHDKGLHSAEEIEEKDPAGLGRSKTGKAQTSVSRQDYERLQAIYKKVKNG